MKTIILLITATGALALASSGFGAVRGVNRLMFDGAYTVNVTETARVCTRPGSPVYGKLFRMVKATTKLSFRIKNGSAGVHPIVFSGLSLVKGELKYSSGSVMDRSTTTIWFIPGYLGNAKGVSVSLISSETGHYVAEGCGGYKHFSGIGHRVGP